MKIKVLFIAVMLSLLASCSLNDSFVSAVDGAWQVIGPEYTQYVTNDATLDQDTKTVRLRTAALLTGVIEEAKK